MSKKYNYINVQSNRTYKNDYKQNTFMTRYHFIGEQNLNSIRKRFFNDPKNISFRRDVEPVYQLTTRIHLIMHHFIEELPHNSKGKLIGIDSIETDKLQTIRNSIAHNGLFWNTPKETGEIYSVYEVFTILMSVILRVHGKERLNDFYSAIYRLFEKEKYAIADEPLNHMQQPKHINRWTEENRIKYQPPAYDVDKRSYIKRRIGRWMSALKKAKKQVISFESNNSICYKKAA